MFAGEGGPARTNRRFKLLSAGQPATRLSTAFDSVTLYGFDPDERPDIYGKVGNSGVSIATLDDMKELFVGFDLCDPATSVSMTINGPRANDLGDVHVHGGGPATRRVRDTASPSTDRCRSRGDQCSRALLGSRHRASRHPQGGPGPETRASSRPSSHSASWPTSPNGSWRTMCGNFYSVSISGYHIAEAGANPVSQLAFTLANGFTYVEPTSPAA